MPDGAVKRKRKRRPPARKRKPLPPSYFWRIIQSATRRDPEMRAPNGQNHLHLAL